MTTIALMDSFANKIMLLRKTLVRSQYKTKKPIITITLLARIFHVILTFVIYISTGCSGGTKSGHDYCVDPLDYTHGVLFYPTGKIPVKTKKSIISISFFAKFFHGILTFLI